MSIRKTERAIEDFLADPTSGVLAIKGEWGVGKTYFWNALLNRFKVDSRLTCKSYAYVSLFGVKDLESLKFSIFEQTVDRQLIGEPVSLLTAKYLSTAGGKKLLRSILSLADKLPWVKGHSGTLLQAFSFLAVSHSLICLDDFERKSGGLSSNDVMGLVSLLKEQRGCKVVLIFNQAKLKDDGEYEQYREKVVDVEVGFSPTPEEAVDVALDPTWPHRDLLKADALRLGIRNIRILKKIEKVAKRIMPLLEPFQKEVTQQALHALTLFGWCYYTKGDAPDFNYVKSLENQFVGFTLGAAKTEEQRQWDSVLSGYGFLTTDEFDLSLAAAITSGHVDDAEIIATASQLDERIEADKSGQSFSAAWDIYHNSFGDDESVLADQLVNAVHRHAKHISLGNFNATIRLLKELGRDQTASELISTYIDQNKGRKGYFDLDRNGFPGDTYDPEIAQRFSAENDKDIEHKSLLETVASIAEKSGWGSEDERILAAASEDDYYRLFKDAPGKELSACVQACLKFKRFSNASEEQMAIGNKAENALRRIAAENRLNAMRVRKFGINLTVPASGNDGD